MAIFVVLITQLFLKENICILASVLLPSLKYLREANLQKKVFISLFEFEGSQLRTAPGI